MPILQINADFLNQLTSQIAGSNSKHSPQTLNGNVPIIECFSGEELGRLPQSTINDAEEAFRTARVAQKIWRDTRYDLRRRLLLRAHDLILEEAETLIDLVQAETGKSRGQAYEELFAAAATCRYVALKTHTLTRSRRLRGSIPILIGTEVHYHPKGVIGVITPWNYPLSLTAFDVLPALATGNAVVQKVDNQASLAALYLRQLLIQAGLPQALWQVVAGPGSEIGQGVVDRCDYLAFTGSTQTGIALAQNVAERMVGASLELGGKNALIVLPDADPRQAARIAAYACFSSLGQLCVSIERIYLVGRVAKSFEREFIAEVESLKIGAAYNYESDLGSLSSAEQLNRLQEHIADAAEQGATILTGGMPLPELGPNFFTPTVLSGVSETMKCFRTETFGPLVALYPVATVQMAVDAANDSEFGLNAAILTDRPARSKKLARQLQAGSVNINEGFRATFSSTHAPMGGFNKSGLGRRNGPDGILRYVESQTVSVARRIISLPTTGGNFRLLAPVMTLLLRVLRLVNRA